MTNSTTHSLTAGTAANFDFYNFDTGTFSLETGVVVFADDSRVEVRLNDDSDDTTFVSFYPETFYQVRAEV